MRIFGITCAIIALPVLGCLFGKTGVLTYLMALIIAVIVITWLMPRDPRIKLARATATILVVLAVILMFVSGLPLLVATVLHPVGQNLQNRGSDAAMGGLVAWVGGMVVLSIVLTVLSGVWYFSKSSVFRVLLSALLLTIALFPVVGVIAQELALHGWS